MRGCTTSRIYLVNLAASSTTRQQSQRTGLAFPREYASMRIDIKANGRTRHEASPWTLWEMWLGTSPNSQSYLRAAIAEVCLPFAYTRSDAVKLFAIGLSLLRWNHPASLLRIGLSPPAGPLHVWNSYHQVHIGHAVAPRTWGLHRTRPRLPRYSAALSCPFGRKNGIADTAFPLGTH